MKQQAQPHQQGYNPENLAQQKHVFYFQLIELRPLTLIRQSNPDLSGILAGTNLPGHDLKNGVPMAFRVRQIPTITQEIIK
ncbi:MAG: hypothetical protein ACYC05_01495 [Sulfuricella sp.]